MCLAGSALWMNLWVPYYIINNEVPCKITIFATSLDANFEIYYSINLFGQLTRTDL